MKKKLIYLLLLLLFYSSHSNGQLLDSLTIENTYVGLDLDSVLKIIETKYELKFHYDDQWIESVKVLSTTTNPTIKAFLNDNLQSVGIEVIEYKGVIAFVFKNNAAQIIATQQDEDLIIIGTEDSFDGESAYISGTILDGNTEEPIIGAQVLIKSLNVGAVTNLTGEYSLKVPTGQHNIQVNSVNYDEKRFDIVVKSPGEFNIELFSKTVELDELVITSQGSDDNIQQNISGVERLGIESIKELPTFLGEVDPIKTLASLPGVSTAGELSSGFNVRGGAAGQNLILQDGATIYNPTHLFGFFSGVNPDFIDNVTLYKGGGPANFGGRISSLLDIKLKNGNQEEFHLNGGVGIVSSRLSVEGPIAKNKSSFIVGGRASYSNWLLGSVKDVNISKSSANFYDVNAKVNQRISNKDRLEASFYRSYDEFKFAADTVYSWYTTNLSLTWNHIINDNNLVTLTAANSNYTSEVTSDKISGQFNYENHISDLTIKLELDKKLSTRNNFLIGLEGQYYDIEPGQLKTPSSNQAINPVNLSNQYAATLALYAQNNYDISTKSSISLGVRYSRFYRLGSGKIYTFEESVDGFKRTPDVIDTLYYSKNDVIKTFNGFEPRISYRYLLSASSSVKMSYYRTYQYLHLISNTVSVTPQDYRIVSGPNITPQIGDQFSVGFFKNFKNNNYEASVESFYKKIQNSIDFVEGADVLLNEELEGAIVQGDGMAYGLEILLKKNEGRLKGWVSYTYTRSLRKFDFGESYKTINEGKYYPTNFDKPNNLSLVLNYKLTGQLHLSANFNYSTGRPITIPQSKFSYEKILSVLNYSDRNEFRIPDYHRLDLSVTLKEGLKNKKIKGEWVLSIFNVYGRKNAYSIFFKETGFAKKLSILGTVFPSITYNFKL